MAPLAKVADSGFHDAGAYDAHRPSYRPEIARAFLDKLQIDLAARGGAPLTIVEIGAGTGKFTEVLSAMAAANGKSDSDCHPLRIIAVEPHDQMRAHLAAKHLPHVAAAAIVDGHGADLHAIETDTADAVVVAQAFHWFATPDALAEIHRVLKPRARLGVIWNVEDYNKPRDWPAHSRLDQALNDVILALPPDGSPRFRDGQWQGVFADSVLFSPLHDDRLPWTATLSPDALWQRLCTLSQIANLAEPARADVQQQVAVAVAAAQPDVPRDAQGNVTIHAVTYFAWAEACSTDSDS